MHVISQKVLWEFWKVDADAETPLRVWYKLMEKGWFESPHDVAALFPGVDFVGSNRAVFDIGGNKYRLVVDIRYEFGRAFVAAVMTHDEYDDLDVTEL